MEPSEKIVQQLPNSYQNYGRTSKLLIAAKDVPNLQFNLGDTEESSKVCEESENSPEGAEEVVEITESAVLPETINTIPTDDLQNSKVHESSRNLLRSALGVALSPTIIEHNVGIISKTIFLIDRVRKITE